MVRVIHIISDTNIGGAGILLCNLLRHTNQGRYMVSVILAKGSDLIPRLEALGVRIDCVEGLGDSANLRALGKLIEILRREKPEIVHTHASFVGRIAARLCGVPIRVMTRHCAFPPSGWLSVFPGKQLNGALQSFLTTRFVAVAQAAKENLTDTGIPGGKVSVILNGCEAIREVSAEELNDLRGELGIPEGAFVVGICARLEACKDHGTFLRAATIALREDRELYFLIVGGGSREEELRQLAVSYGIDDHVKFCGFVSDPAPYYRLFSVNVNCSVGTETSCLAISEGYSAGVPAVVSDFGGNPDMVENVICGFVVKQRDAEAYAEKILWLKRHPDAYQTMSKRARECYEKKYTASVMTARLEAMYEDLLRGQNGRTRSGEQTV